MSEELKRLLESSHEDITMIDFNGKDTPCILFEEARYDYIMSQIAGKPVIIDTDLNILHDGLGHVFVKIFLTFSIRNIREELLVNANKHLDFFESLVETSMFVISSPRSHYGRENILAVNLPRPDKTRKALDTIKNGLNAVTGI